MLLASNRSAATGELSSNSTPSFFPNDSHTFLFKNSQMVNDDTIDRHLVAHLVASADSHE